MGENTQEHNLNWPQIPDHPLWILIVHSPGYGKKNALLDLLNHQPDIHKIYLYTTNSYEPKYQLLINKWQDADLNEYSNDIKDVYKSIEEYNPGMKSVDSVS